MVNYSGSSDVWAREGLLERLKTLYWEGVSSSQTAKILNQEFGLSLTRNAVIGKVHRCGFYSDRSAVSSLRWLAVFPMLAGLFLVWMGLGSLAWALGQARKASLASIEWLAS